MAKLRVPRRVIEDFLFGEFPAAGEVHIVGAAYDRPRQQLVLDVEGLSDTPEVSATFTKRANLHIAFRPKR